MMLFIGSMVSLALLISVLSPFWLGKGGLLLPASTLNDPEKARRLKKTVLTRYLSDENAFREGAISKSEWNQRRQFLTNRYIDLSRRLDFLTDNMTKESGDGKEQQA